MARRFGPLGQASGFGRRVRLIAARAPGPLLLAGEPTAGLPGPILLPYDGRSAEHTSEPQSLMRISYAVFCLQQKNTKKPKYHKNNGALKQRRITRARKNNDTYTTKQRNIQAGIS